MRRNATQEKKSSESEIEFEWTAEFMNCVLPPTAKLIWIESRKIRNKIFFNFVRTYWVKLRGKLRRHFTIFTTYNRRLRRRRHRVTSAQVNQHYHSQREVVFRKHFPAVKVVQIYFCPSRFTKLSMPGKREMQRNLFCENFPISTTTNNYFQSCDLASCLWSNGELTTEGIKERKKVFSFKSC